MLKSNRYKQKIGSRGYYLNGNLHKEKYGCHSRLKNEIEDWLVRIK